MGKIIVARYLAKYLISKTSEVIISLLTISINKGIKPFEITSSKAII